MRLDAGLYDPPPAREKGKKGAPRKEGERQPTLAQRLCDPKIVIIPKALFERLTDTLAYAA